MSRIAVLLLLLVGAAQARVQGSKTKTMADLMNYRHRQNPITVPEQGYDGKDIKHETMCTATGDWGTEYGPKEKKAAPPPPQKAYGARSSVPAVVSLAAMLMALRL